MPGVNKDWNAKLITMKVETTEGTDAAPTPVANALRVLNYQPQFMDADQKVRALEKQFFGADPVYLSALKRGATFDMEMHGAGTATGIVPWATMLRLAGYSAGVVGASSVVYSPITAGWPSGTHYGYIDDLQLIAIGGRANVAFKIEDEEYPLFTFNYLGRPPATLAAQVVPATGVITGYQDPVVSSSENTTFTLGGYSPGLRSWEMNANVDLQFRSLIGPQDRVNARNRSWSGTVLIEIPDLAVKDYFANVRPGTILPATAIQGVATGNIVQIDARLQISGNVELSEDGGKAMASLPVTAVPSSAGNDEVIFTTK
jgi:hypothetical protein